MGEMDAITSSGTRKSRTDSGTFASTPSDKITVSSPGYQRTASARSLTPSAANSPASSLAFREESSFFTCCNRGFFREVILCSVTASAPC